MQNWTISWSAYEFPTLSYAKNVDLNDLLSNNQTKNISTVASDQGDAAFSWKHVEYQFKYWWELEKFHNKTYQLHQKMFIEAIQTFYPFAFDIYCYLNSWLEHTTSNTTYL